MGFERSFAGGNVERYEPASAMDPQTIETYDRMAEEYDKETADFWEKFPREVFDKFSESIRGRVLDIGSGPGRDGLLLQERSLDVVCIDASKAMVEMCQTRGLQAIQADFMNIPFADGEFNGIWAYTSLLHIPKTEMPNALREATRVLRPKGVLGLGMIEGDFEGYRESSGVDLPRYFSHYQKEELDKLLDEAGLQPFYFGSFRLEGKTRNYLNYLTRKV